MKLEITARHFKLSQSLHEKINKKIVKIEKYNIKIIICKIILTKEVSSEDVEIICQIKNKTIVSKECLDNFSKSFSKCLEKIIVQIKKQHNKIIDH